MSKSKAEKERKYYNKKLINESFKSEIKKPHKVDWKDLITDCIGIYLGLTITKIIKIESLINNAFGRLITGTFIIVVAILIIKVLVYEIYKLTKKEN